MIIDHVYNYVPKSTTGGKKFWEKNCQGASRDSYFSEFFHPVPLLFLKSINIFGTDLLYRKFTQPALVQSVVRIVLWQIICATLFVWGWKRSMLYLPSDAFFPVCHGQVDSIKNWAPNSNRTWDMCKLWGQPPSPPRDKKSSNSV